MDNLTHVSKYHSGVLVRSLSEQNPPNTGKNKQVYMDQRRWPWHHGSITHNRVEELLSSCADGVFLVHDSIEFPGEHNLSVLYDSMVYRYRIKWKTMTDSPELCLTIDDKNFFFTMSDLINYYSREGSLCTILVRYLPRAGDSKPLTPQQPYVSGTRPPRTPTPIDASDEDECDD